MWTRIEKGRVIKSTLTLSHGIILRMNTRRMLPVEYSAILCSPLIRCSSEVSVHCDYSRVHKSVNTENSFFGRDVTYLPKKDIFPRPDSHADGSGL